MPAIPLTFSLYTLVALSFVLLSVSQFGVIRGRRKWCAPFLAISGSLLLVGCGGGKPSVVLYSDIDRAVVEPLVKQYEKEANIEVTVVYAGPKDARSGVGLSDRIREESSAPQADVYWAEGPVAIEKLHQEGLLDAYRSDTTSLIAPPFQGAKSEWIGLGARVRVILYNTRKIRPKEAPQSLASLAQPAWKGRAAFADPRSNGSSNYHVRALFTILGVQEGQKWLEAVKANEVQLLPDEAAVADAVASGKADWGIVDSDVALAAVRAKKPVNYVVADQEAYSTGQALGKPRGELPTLGTPLLPAPLALLHNRPHRRESHGLMEFLASKRVASRLLELQPARFSTHQDILTSLVPSLQSQPLDPLSLSTVRADEDALYKLRPQVTNALNAVFR